MRLVMRSVILIYTKEEKCKFKYNEFIHYGILFAIHRHWSNYSIEMVRIT
jgi:hypothetical protein